MAGSGTEAGAQGDAAAASARYRAAPVGFFGQKLQGAVGAGILITFKFLYHVVFEISRLQIAESSTGHERNGIDDITGFLSQ